MNFVIILGIFLAALQISHQNKFAGTLTKNFFKTHEEAKKQCLDEIHVDQKLETIYENTGDIENDRNLRCFVMCTLVKAGAISEDGEIFAANITRNLQLKDPSIAEKMRDDCSGFDTVDICKGAKQFVDCGLRYLEAHL